MLQGYDGFSGAMLDYPEPTPVTKSYVLASTFRSGSTHFCMSLWESGALGAPWEYFNFDNTKRYMYSRLQAKSQGDYVRRLLAVRTAPNGVFGVKSHFHHFRTALRDYPPLLEMMAPVRYIYGNRRNKLAQAVSLARALQTNVWMAFEKQE